MFSFFYRTRLSLLLYKVFSVRIGSAKKISVLSGLIITFLIWKFTCNLIFQYFQTKVAVLTPARHIRRFQEYFNHINILISSSTLQILLCILIPKWCKLPFLDSKINTDDIKLYFKSYDKIPRWRYCWSIWHLIVKTKMSPLVVCYQGSDGCQKYRQNLTKLDLEVYCS